MVLKNQTWALAVLITVIMGIASNLNAVTSRPYRMLMDTDVDTDDFFALLYLLKLNRSEFDLKGVTINSNGWTNAGHAANHLYDMLFMMGRDDIPVGVGGEGGITQDGSIQPNVGGFLPLIEQGMTTAGYCRYRQAIPLGPKGKLDIDTNFGIRKAFLPQGSRKYVPLSQATAQEVMIDVISKGPTRVFLMGAHTNFAVFLMSNPQLKKNVEHVYVMGGGVGANNPDCCRGSNPSSTCQPDLCGDVGNIFTAYSTNPYAEYNIFSDPFAAYQVLHSGIPVTLVPLDATNTVPITKNFLDALEQNQKTYEAQYCFKTLQMARDSWSNDQFYQSYFMWDSFTAGVAISIMHNNKPNGENEFSEMEYMNITVITSNKPYGISDGSNPFFDGQQTPQFHLKKDGVHSGHVQTGLKDAFCLVKHGKGRCEDGYTKKVVGSEAVRVLVATKSKPNRDPRSPFITEFFSNFLEVINQPQQSGRFNITTQFPYHKHILYKPDFGSRKLGKPVVFDMDMDAGDFLALFYLLKVPVQELDLKAILVTPTGWASAATIDVVYDLLHMMGRDDIPVGLGDFFAMNQSSDSSVGDCKYSKAIPLGGGGLLDSDTLYGLARSLPKSPRRYTAENSLRYGAPPSTHHLELRQPKALEIWEMVKRTNNPKTKLTILTSGPLTTLAKIVLSDKDASSFIQDVFVVGGNVDYTKEERGNAFTIHSNGYAELNIFLDPVAAKTVFQSELNITLIPLGVQRKVNSFPHIIDRLYETKKTPEVTFARHLIHQLQSLQRQSHRYQHMDIFLGEILGPVILAEEQSLLNSEFKVKPISIIAVGDESVDGQMEIDEKNGKRVKVIEEVDQAAYYGSFASRLGDEKQSAVLGSFSLQKKLWSTPRRHPTKE
ncbi:hypothetical protein V2J09_005616 [Rumex salicifolius]